MTKYSLKNIFLGVGIGLIISSMANISAAPESLTKDEVIREAQRYNLIVMDAKDMIKKEAPAPTPEQPESKPEEQGVVTIVIESGATSEGIAEQLLSNKLISSKQEFLHRLREQKKESKVQIGSFKIPQGSSLDKIIEIITTSPR
ncbi:MAG: hypothetical protein K0R84_2883 [Clostridia bacterium]|jgi:hypothetical protein|nr:hypothetical protein [Clostridia bacterium]